MSQQGRLKVITDPGTVFAGTQVGDFTISSSGAVFLGSAPSGVLTQAQIVLNGNGIALNQPLNALAGITGSISTSSIVSTAGISVASGTGVIAFDSVHIKGGDLTCATLETGSLTASVALTAPELVLPKATLSCPTGAGLAVALSPSAPLATISCSDGSPASLSVATLVTTTINSGANSPTVHVQDSLLVDDGVTLGAWLTVAGNCTLQTGVVIGNSSSAQVTTPAPYLNVTAPVRTPTLQLGTSGTSLSAGTLGTVPAVVATAASGLPVFQSYGLVLQASPATLPSVALRNVGGSVAAVTVSNGLMTQYASFGANTLTLTDTSGAFTTEALVNAASEFQVTTPVNTPGLTIRSASGASTVHLTAGVAGAASDSPVIAPAFNVGTSGVFSSQSGGGVSLSSLLNAPSVVLRNTGTPALTTSAQTDADGGCRLTAPLLRLAGSSTSTLQPENGGTALTPGVLDLAYSTFSGSTALMRLSAGPAGLTIGAQKLLMEGGASYIMSNAATGTLTTSVTGLSLGGLATLSGTTGNALNVLAQALTIGGAGAQATITPLPASLTFGPASQFALQAQTSLVLGAASSVAMQVIQPDGVTPSAFAFQAGSQGQLLVNGADIGLPHDALAGLTGYSGPDAYGWYTFTNVAGATVLKAYRHDGGRPTLLRTPAEAFIIPGYSSTTGAFAGSSSTTYAAAGGGFGSYVAGYVEIQLTQGVTPIALQTTLQTAGQTANRPANFILFAKGAGFAPWVPVVTGGSASSTPAPYGTSSWTHYRFAVSQVTSGVSVSVAQLNLLGGPSAPPVLPQRAFVGQHYAVPAAGQTLANMLPGMVVSCGLGCDSVGFGGVKLRGSGASGFSMDAATPMVALTTARADPAVFGVISAIAQNAWVPYADARLVINSQGEGSIWVTLTNGVIAAGDLLQAGSVAGYAEKQGTTAVTSSTVAKSTMNCSFAPVQVPVLQMVTGSNGAPTLDSQGLVTWAANGALTEPQFTTALLPGGVLAALISCVYML